MRALRLILTSLAVLSAAPVAAQKQPPFPQGLFGDVSLGEESGDLGGFEVRFFVDPAGRQMAEFTLCEGWCNIVYTAEVTRDGDGFVFSHIETLESSSGERWEHRVSYHVVPVGRRVLKVYYRYDDRASEAEPWRIKRIRKPYGLTVARGDQTPPAP